MITAEIETLVLALPITTLVHWVNRIWSIIRGDLYQVSFTWFISVDDKAITILWDPTLKPVDHRVSIWAYCATISDPMYKVLYNYNENLIGQ